MSRRIIPWGLLLAGVVFCFGRVASAAPAINIGTIQIHPNTVKTFVVNVTGGGNVQGLDLYLQIGDGGAVNGGTNSRPVITAVDIVGPGTLFNASTTGQQNAFSSDLLWATSTTTDPNQASYLNASGVLVYVTIDAAGTAPGQSYGLLLSGVATGIFGNPGVDTAFAGVSAQITNGVVNIVSGPLIPDVNNDGFVDSGDLAIMGGSWKQSGRTWVQGDLNDDGWVDGGDLALLGGCWNWIRPAPPVEGAPLPEPATLALLIAGAGAMVRRRRV